jgi:hypothetical protein
LRTPIGAYRKRGSKRRVLVEKVRFLAGYRRPGLVDEAPLEHAFAQVVDGEPLGVVERRLTGNEPLLRVRPALLALLGRHRLVMGLSRPLSAASALRRCS